MCPSFCRSILPSHLICACTVVRVRVYKCQTTYAFHSERRVIKSSLTLTVSDVENTLSSPYSIPIMCIRVYVCVCVCVFSCTCVYEGVYMKVWICSYRIIDEYMYVLICTHVYNMHDVFIHVCVHVPVCVPVQSTCGLVLVL